LPGAGGDGGALRDHAALWASGGAVRYPVGRSPSMSVGSFVRRWSGLGAGSRERAEAVRLCGRIASRRDASRKLFLFDLEGGSTGDGGAAPGELSRVQVLVSRGELESVATKGSEPEPGPAPVSVSVSGPGGAPFEAVYASLRRGDVVAVEGFPGKTNTGELSLCARSVELLAPCLRNVPDAGTLQDPETRARRRYLDLMVNGEEARRPVVARARLLRALRDSLHARGFLEVETPVLSHSSGGAIALPFHTHARALDDTLALRIAPELFLKQCVVGGLERVFEIGKVFRNEGIDLTHNPEFSSCELYQAHAALPDLMHLTQQLLHGT
jgi:lysyl-tRNA synthetase class 2